MKKQKEKTGNQNHCFNGKDILAEYTALNCTLRLRATNTNLTMIKHYVSTHQK